MPFSGKVHKPQLSPLELEDAETRKQRIRALYDKIDADKSGHIDTKDLERKFRELRASRNIESESSGVPLGSTQMYAKELLKRCDSNSNGTISYPEFEAFVEAKEKELWELFKQIDTGKDNLIGADELQSSLKKAGIDLSSTELSTFMNHIDSARDGVIDFNEWRDFLLLLPHSSTIHNIFTYYQSVLDVDINVDSTPLPDHLANKLDERVKYFLAGGLAGTVSRTVTAPLDRVKVLLQTQTEACKTVASRPASVSIWTAMRRIYEIDGLRGFYRGNGLNIIKIFPESALKFFVFEYTKEWVRKTEGVRDKESISVAGRFFAGGTAGLASQFAIYPLETLKTRMMAQIRAEVLEVAQSEPLHSIKPKPNAPIPPPPPPHQPFTPSTTNFIILKTLKEMYREGGIRPFFRGCVPALVGIVPYAGIDLGVFETLKTTYVKLNPEIQQPSVLSLLAFGMISGTVGATIVYPLSLVRTRLQAQGTPSHPQRYKSAFDVIQKTYSKESVRGFYKGLVPTLMKVVPAISISYVVYERTKRSLGIR